MLWSDATVQRFDGYASTTAPLTFMTSPSAQSVAVDTQGRVYALVPYGDEAGIHRFLPNGTKDAAHAQQGIAKLDAAFGGLPICYPGYLTALGDELLLSDTCNARLLRFNAQGAFVEALQFDINDGIVEEAVYWDGATAWVAQARKLSALTSTSGMLHVSAQVAVANGTLNSVRALWRSPQGQFWALDSTNVLVGLDANGAELTRYDGGYVTSIAGAFPLGRALIPLTDGSLAVMSTDAKRFERFSATLK